MSVFPVSGGYGGGVTFLQQLTELVLIDNFDALLLGFAVLGPFLGLPPVLENMPSDQVICPPADASSCKTTKLFDQILDHLPITML